MAETAAVDTNQKRTTSDLEVIQGRAGLGDWLHVQRKLEMTKAEILEDGQATLTVFAYFISKQSGAGAKFDHWMHAPFDEVVAFVNLDVDEEDENE